MPKSRSWRTTQAKLASRCRTNPEDHAAIDALRAELRAQQLEEHIRAVVDDAPPLTAAQRDHLAVLLRPSTSASEGARTA